MAFPSYEEHQKQEEALANAPLPPAYKSQANGRVFRATATLHKHAAKLKLIPLDTMPEELKSQKERNIEAALAKKAEKELAAKQEAEQAAADAKAEAELQERTAKNASTRTRRQKATEATE